MAENNNTNEVYVMNKDMSNSVKNTFNSHYNLYQKSMLQEKISCFDRFYKTPSAYYDCLESIDQKMAQNSTYLQKKFQSLEHFKSECEEQCKTGYAAYPKEFIDCMKKCCDTMKGSAIATYSAFYEGQLGKNPEYKNIKI